MLGPRNVTVGDLTHFPQKLDRSRRRCQRGNVIVARQEPERLDISLPAPWSAPGLAAGRPARLKPGGGEGQVAIAPLQDADGLETMVLELADQLGGERLGLGRDQFRLRSDRRDRRSGQARPPSAGGRWLPNFRVEAKATWSRSMLRPMPIASVATT